MIHGFERRMIVIAAVAIGSGFAALILGIMILASTFYVGMLMRYEGDVINDARAILLDGGLPDDARRGGELLAARFFRTQLRITVLDGKRRTQISRSPGDTAPTVSTQNVDTDPSTDYMPGSAVGRLTMAFATLVGLHAMRAGVGPLVVVARADPAALIADFWRIAPLLAVALLVGVVLAIVLGRVVVHEALRPLDTAILQREAALVERDRAHAAMRQFISDAAHQLRTPLTVIRGFIGILQRGGLRVPTDRERILDTMNKQCLLMGSLVEKLILLDQWEHASDPTPEPIDVAQLVVDVVGPIAESAPQREVRVQVAPRSALARIDPSDCSYALTNLLENALKYAGDGPIDVALDADDDRIRVSVSDCGPGMNADEAQHAFDRFFRGALHRDIAGSGLGLAIARRAVERARGTLTLDTAPGRGSRFIIDLPRSARLGDGAPVQNSDLNHRSRVG